MLNVYDIRIDQSGTNALATLAGNIVFDSSSAGRLVLETKNIKESSSNLYYTDERVYNKIVSFGTTAGGYPITLTGNITGSGTGNINTTITNSAVTYDKIQNVSGNKILGNVGVAGNVEEIALTSGLAFSGNTIGLENSGVVAGTYNNVTVTEKGIVTSGLNVDYANFGSNGITKIGNTVILGGALNQNTTITTGSNLLTIAGSNGLRYLSDISTHYTNRSLVDKAYVDTQILISDTGVLTFGGLIQTSPTTFDIGAVTGYIVDNETSPGIRQFTYVTYAGATGQTTPYLASADATYVLLNSSGNIVYQPTFPTSAQRKSMIYLGKMAHASRTTIALVLNNPDYIISPISQYRDLYQVIKYINDGIKVTANGANLNINLIGGNIHGANINYVNDRTTPNEYAVASSSGISFVYRTQNGGTTGSVTLIDPTRYDNAGVITTIGGSNNKATNQRIYATQAGSIIIQYGQTVYNTLTEAIANAQREEFTTFVNLIQNAILIGILTVTKGCTALNNTSNAKFLLTDKFGQISGAAAGISTSTLQLAYNNSTEPEILTNSTHNAIIFKRGSSSDTDAVFQIQNGAGTVTWEVNGNGVVTNSSLSPSQFVKTDSSKNLVSQNGILVSDISVSGNKILGNVGIAGSAEELETTSGITLSGKTIGLANSGVTYSKIQNITADRILGRVTSTGQVQELALSSGLAFSGASLMAVGGGSGNVMLTGDVTGSGSDSIATTISNGVVTYSKIQNVSGNRILGNVGVTGVVEEIALTSGLAFSGNTIGLANSGVVAGTYNNVTVTEKGIITSGILKDYTTNQIISLSGDITGSGSSGISTTIGANKVTNSMLRQSSGLSVIGRSANSTGNVADITASSDGQFLGRQSGTLGFFNLSGQYVDRSTSQNVGGVKTFTSGIVMSGSDINMSGQSIINILAVTNGSLTFDLNQQVIKTSSVENINFFNRTLRNSSGLTRLDWEQLQLSGTWRSNGIFQLGSTLSINDSLTYKTALSVPSTGVLGFGKIASEFTSFEFGDMTLRNGLRINTSTSGSAVNISAQGVNTNINLQLESKGAGTINFQIGTAYLMSLPTTAPLANQVLQYNGSTYIWNTVSGGGSGTITLSGDVTGSGSAGITTTIANDAVTYAKMQNVSGNKILGHVGIAGNIQELEATSGLAFSGTTLFANYENSPYKNICRVTTTANLTSTYANGVSGVGATLTATTNVVLPTQDGVSLAVGDRILVKNQSTTFQNGIYVVTSLGSAGVSPWILTRATDSNTAIKIYQTSVTVKEGSTFSNTQWLNTNTSLAITIGTTAVTYAIVGGYTISTGLTLTNRTITVATAGVTRAMLSNSSAVSVIGRSANSTGVPADIAASSNGLVLKRVGNAVGFHGIGTDDLNNSVVTYAKIQNVSGVSIIGRSANSTGVAANITASSDGQVLKRVGNTVGFHGIGTADLNTAIVTYDKIQNITANRILGRVTSTGQVQELALSSGLAFSGASITATGGGATILSANESIIEASWSGNTDYQYSVTVTGAAVGDFCLVMPDEDVTAAINTANVDWKGYAYCTASNNVTVICRVSSFISIPASSIFTVKVIK